MGSWAGLLEDGRVHLCDMQVLTSKQGELLRPTAGALCLVIDGQVRTAGAVSYWALNQWNVPAGVQ